MSVNDFTKMYINEEDENDSDEDNISNNDKESSRP